MKILVTGGAGFIGSHLVDALLARGHEVTVVDDLSTGRRSNVSPAVRFIEGDLRDSKVGEALSKEKFDLVSHQAAQMNVRHSVSDPAWDADVNLVGALRLVEALVRGGLRNIVFASSGGAVYGEPVSVPQNEGDPAAPVSPYGCAKLAFEHYLHYYASVHDVRTVALRYANVYGPRQNEHGEAGVVAIWAKRLLRNETIFVNGSGCQTRDFVYVDDVVAANVAAIESSRSGIFNVGTGIETSINDLAKAMRAAIAGCSSPIEHRPAKAGEQMRSVLDTERLRASFDLPNPMTLEAGLRVTIDSVRQEI